MAVFDIHMLIIEDASKNPKTTPRSPPPPNAPTTPSATRRWAPLFSIADERSKPPITRRITGWP